MEGVRLTPIRRAPSKHRKIEDIDQKDIRISLIGAVVSKKDFEFVLDDGTGQINVICEEDTEFKEGDLVRVVGRLRISLIGAVVSKKDFEFVLDDGTGQINVICEEDTEFKEGNLVRVVGRLFTDIVQAEIVRKIDDMDMELYNTYRLIKEYF